MLRVYDEPARRIGAESSPLDRAWVHVSLAVAHARLGNRQQSVTHARVAAESRLAHEGREPKVAMLTARLAALRGQERRMFAALKGALAAGWMDAAVLDHDPVFQAFRWRPEFVALRADLDRRMREARSALGTHAPRPVKIASAPDARRTGPGATAGHP